MIDNKIYSDNEIESLMKNINHISYIGNDKYKVEKFKQIKIYNDYIPYIISSYGRIFSINYSGKKHNVKQLKTQINITGYERITITYLNMVLNLSIHRIVAFAFIYNSDIINKIEVNHIDGNKLNNTIENLEWVTPEENIKHAFDIKLRKYGENSSNSKYTSDQIIKVCEMIVNDYKIKDICKITGVAKYTIKDILYGRSWLNISCNYDFSKYHYGISHEEYKKYIQNIYNICIMLEENFPLKYIKNRTGFTENQISKILHKRTNTDISNNYDFSKYNYGKPYNYEDIIHEICMYGESGKYSMREISKITNISYRTVQHILYGEIYKKISKEYNLEKYQKKNKL